MKDIKTARVRIINWFISKKMHSIQNRGFTKIGFTNSLVLGGEEGARRPQSRPVLFYNLLKLNNLKRVRKRPYWPLLNY
jgi:hypothetical protein